MPETAVTEVPQTSIPASSSPTSSTPVTSTTQTAPTTTAASERPNEAKLGPQSSAKDIAAFLKAGATAADATTPQAPLVADPAAAPTTPPTTAPAPGDPDATAKWIPLDAHQTSLKNAREKAVALYRQQHGWAEQFTPQQRAWMLDMAQRMNDPIAFHRWFGEQLASDPRFKSQLTPAAAQPDVEILDANGKPLGKLSDILKAERAQLERQFSQMLQPLQQDRDARIRNEQIAEQQKALDTKADAVMARVNKILRLETFSKDEQAALGAKLLDELSRTPDAIDASLMVFERDVLPMLEKKGQQAAVDTHLKKAAGNTVNGTGGPTKPSISPKSTPKEIAAYLRALDGA